MAREFEKAGLSTVHMCSLVSISLSVGVNRIVPTISIPYPLGDPGTPKEKQWNLRYRHVGAALDALTAEIAGQIVFEVPI